MASDTERSKRDESRSHGASSDSDSDSDSGSNSEASSSHGTPQPVEWLATARERRSTAGNRMKSMLANEEPDSDLELLFAEDENDQGFSDVDDDGSDAQMDSSSDDEDENNAPDDMEGEKELERQAKERRAAQRKRRAQEAIPAKFRKRVRIDPTTAAPAPRPKKKSERASWLPSPADLPTRASSRKTTRLSKEQLHQQMMEREERRLKQMDQMAKKAAKLEAMKKPPMTQEERLREAAIVEKRNSKSLNRWEEAEKQREEERRAKLAALNNRTLKGPVITFWSGLGESEGKSTHVGKIVMEEKPKKKREKKDKGKDQAEVKGQVQNGTPELSSQPIQPTQSTQPAQPSTQQTPSQPTEPQQPKPVASQGPSIAPQPEPAAKPPAPAPKIEETPQLMAIPSAAPAPPPSHPPSGLAAPSSAPPAAPMPPPQETSRSVLTPPPGLSRPSNPKTSGVLAAPILAPPPGIGSNGIPMLGFGTGSPKSNVLAPPNTSSPTLPPSLAVPNPVQPVPADSGASPVTKTETKLEPASTTTPATQKAPEPTPKDIPLQPIRNPPALFLSKAGSATPSEPLSEPPPETPPPEIVTRNTIIFQNFDENAIKDRNVQTQILFNRKMTKLPKPTPAPLCVITHHPARYRDPKTGLPYYNAYAYREIQRLRRGDYHWSKLLGAWVGSGTYAARGVPERFLHPEKESPNKKALEEKKKAEEEAQKKKAEEEEGEKAEAEKKPEEEVKDTEKKDIAEKKDDAVAATAAEGAQPQAVEAAAS